MRRLLCYYAQNNVSQTPKHGLRVMSYNILADQYAHDHAKDLYSAVPLGALNWGSRAALISKEVAHWSPDVVCFQEVDHFSHLETLLERHGYKGTYEQRTGGRPDGLATFWNSKKFEIESQHRINFASMDLKDNVAQLSILKWREENDSSHLAAVVQSEQSCSRSGSRGGHHLRFATDSEDEGPAIPDPVQKFLIANIHVLFNPKRGDIKIAQVRILLETAHRLASSQGPCPVIICGDFNSAVGSDLYDFVMRGELELRSTDRRYLSGQVEVAKRSGWRAIQNVFLSALQAGEASSESEALAMAIGECPVKLSTITVRSTRGAVEDPQRLLVDVAGGGIVTASSDEPTRPYLLRTDSGLGSTLSSSCEASRKPWTEEQLRLAVGASEETNSCTEDEDPCSTVRHPLHLESAYRSVTGVEPLYSTVHDRYVGTVDYIFYSPVAPVDRQEGGSVRLRPLQVLQPPPLQTLKHGLPSIHWPSDHVSLLADFEIFT